MEGADQEVKNALLVLEPRNGGDAQSEAPDQYLVEQYKTRVNGTWALTDVETILRDLRKAVPSSLPANAHYRFVTDGRSGRLKAFKDFLDALKSVEGPDYLNNDEKRKFRSGLTVTDREFFDHIVTETRSGDPQQKAKERAVVFHLLSHFKMEFCVTSSSLIEKIEGILCSYVADLHDERGVRERLVGLLMDRLSKGEIRLNFTGLGSLLREADLNIERLRNLRRLPETMAELSQARLGRIGYQREKDVREVPDWPEEKPVLLITGESGAGKTWQLGKYLEGCAESRRAATLVGAKTAEDILTWAARDIWQEGLGETSEKSLLAVSNFLRELAPNTTIPLLTVAIDDIQEVYVARDLIRRDWMRWRMRLILAVPDTVARALEHTDSETIHVHRVSDFSVNELDALLKQHGQQWADLPSDLKKLLCKPILAGLFVELPYTSFQDAPCSEYEIFEKFWEKIAAKCRPGDEGIVTALAAHMHEDKSYPLPRPEWQEIGLTDGNLERLQAAGWLRSLENSEVEFVHDRLLNWAVAKYLARKFQRGELSVDDLYNTLVVKDKEQERRLFQRLGYVLMDTFWLLAAEDAGPRTLVQLMAKVDDYTFENYIRLLPTLGQRSVPILLKLLNRITPDSSRDYEVSLIRKALVNLAQQEKIKLGDEITALLKTSDRFQQSVAIAVLEAVPDPRHLDRLWELHQQHGDALDNKTDGYKIGDYQASFAALRAGIKQDPKWLRNRILTADKNKERISELGYLLSGLDHTDAPIIWRDMSDVLMSKISQNKPRSLINCITRFEDHEKIDFVIEHLSCSEDFADMAALEALTILAPQEAIDRLIEVKANSRNFNRNQWLPHLLRIHPEHTRQKILELAQSAMRGYWLIAEIFWERPDELDEATLRFVLRTLETDLRDLRDSFAEEPFILNNPLEFLGRIACPKLLKILQAEAGGELERLIVEVAFSQLHTNSVDFNYILENARRILILIGGQGITTLINRELESEHFWVRYGGLKWAFVRADDCTIKQLTAIARRPIPRDTNGQPESGPFQEFHQAMTAIAALGADSVLVEILLSSAFLKEYSYILYMRPKGSADRLEYRRQWAAALLDEGKSINEVARLVKASPSSVHRWKELQEKHGAEGLKAKPHPGRGCRLSAQDKAQLKKLLLAGPQAAGFDSALWDL